MTLKPLLLTLGLLLVLSAGLSFAACLSGNSTLYLSPTRTSSTKTAVQAVTPTTRTPLAEAPLASPRLAEVRQAAQRALPYLEQHGVAWMDKHGCVSCHQVPSMLWSFHEAAAHDLDFDRARLDEWDRWSLEKSMEVGTDNFDGFHQMILGRGSPPASDDGPGDNDLAEFIAQAQKPDGSWEAGGQLPLQRRPAEETHRVSSAWSVLALARVGGQDEALKRGQKQLESQMSEPGQSHEWLIVRLLYAHQVGDEEQSRDLLEQVLKEQQEDGGWAWIRGESSDAFATGQTLYALERLGLSGSDSKVEKARSFLLETQQEDGSWIVRSTLSREHGATPTSNYWGTSWAVVGLLRTLSD